MYTIPWCDAEFTRAIIYPFPMDHAPIPTTYRYRYAITECPAIPVPLSVPKYHYPMLTCICSEWLCPHHKEGTYTCSVAHCPWRGAFMSYRQFYFVSLPYAVMYSIQFFPSLYHYPVLYPVSFNFPLCCPDQFPCIILSRAVLYSVSFCVCLASYLSLSCYLWSFFCVLSWVYEYVYFVLQCGSILSCLISFLPFVALYS